jgi:chromosome partitioning protein
MKRVIAIAMQKGGVGKTTTAVNLAASLAATRRRVLLIDMDPQGNTTMGSGVDKSQLTRSTCEVLLGECDLAAALLPVELPNGGFTLLPANQDLTAAEVRLLTLPIGRETKLRHALTPKRDEFDVILIDCPPALNMLTVNALVAADSVLIPMQCEYYALEGLSALLNTIEQIRDAVNPQLAIEGVLRTMFDPRNNLANEVSAQLITHFGDKVFRTVIPRNIRLAEAPSFGKPALFHDKESRGALAYLALAGEMIRREEEVDGVVRVAPGAMAAATTAPEPARVPSAAAPAPATAPGGAAPGPATAHGTAAHAPATAPGTAPQAPATAPGATAQPPAAAPGAAAQPPASHPGGNAGHADSGTGHTDSSPGHTDSEATGTYRGVSYTGTAGNGAPGELAAGSATGEDTHR